MVCPKALFLLDSYYAALNTFHTAREGGNCRDRDLRFAELSRARMEYWKHVESHGCRRALNGGYHLATEQRLRDEMEQARRRYDDAHQDHTQLAEVAADCWGSSDGALALKKATELHAKARQQYKAAFRRFADYVVHGKPPDDTGN